LRLKIISSRNLSSLSYLCTKGKKSLLAFINCLICFIDLFYFIYIFLLHFSLRNLDKFALLRMQKYFILLFFLNNFNLPNDTEEYLEFSTLIFDKKFIHFFLIIFKKRQKIVDILYFNCRTWCIDVVNLIGIAWDLESCVKSSPLAMHSCLLLISGFWVVAIGSWCHKWKIICWNFLHVICK